MLSPSDSKMQPWLAPAPTSPLLPPDVFVPWLTNAGLPLGVLVASPLPQPAYQAPCAAHRDGLQTSLPPIPVCQLLPLLPPGCW